MMSERATLLAKAVVAGWRGKDAIPCIAEAIDMALSARDEEWRQWVMRLEAAFNEGEPSMLFLQGHPPPDRQILGFMGAASNDRCAGMNDDPQRTEEVRAALSVERERHFETQMLASAWQRQHDALLGWIQHQPQVLRGLLDSDPRPPAPKPADLPSSIAGERERCARIADNYGREGDLLSKEFACEVADEIAARIRSGA